MIPIDLTDKKILMTGALGGIAEYVINVLKKAGAKMILTDLKPEEEVVPVLKSRGWSDLPYFPMDVTDSHIVQKTVDHVFDKWPDLQIALGHAGGTHINNFLDASANEFDDLVKFNFTGQGYFARAVGRQWRDRNTPGHLIFTSSYVSRIPMAGISTYTASKAALEMLTKNLALEFAEYKIRVNAISPGNVKVGKSKEIYDSDPVYRAWVDRVSPLGERNSPEAIANAFLYLCSPLADELDGHTLLVDNGVGLPKLG